MSRCVGIYGIKESRKIDRSLTMRQRASNEMCKMHDDNRLKRIWPRKYLAVYDWGLNHLSFTAVIIPGHWPSDAVCLWENLLISLTLLVQWNSWTHFQETWKRLFCVIKSENTPSLIYNYTMYYMLIIDIVYTCHFTYEIVQSQLFEWRWYTI